MKRFSATQLKGILATGIILLLFASCQNEEVCEEAASSPLRMAFYVPGATAGTTRAFIVDSLTVYGVGRPDSLIYNNSKGIKSIEVPVNPNSARTGFVLVFPGNNTDTVWVESRFHLRFISANCGFAVQPEIERVTHTTRRINSLQISQNLVTQSFEEHIKILLFTGSGS